MLGSAGLTKTHGIILLGRKKERDQTTANVFRTASSMTSTLFSVALVEVFTRALAGRWFQRAVISSLIVNTIRNFMEFGANCVKL